MTTDFETSPHADDPTNSNTFHCAAWAGETLLSGIFPGATISDNLDDVAATPGSFTAHLQGSTHPDPRTGTGGTAYRYYVHLADGGDPRSNGVEIAYAEQAGLGNMNDGAWRWIELRRTANKDMCSAGNISNVPVIGDHVIFRDCAVHGPVGAPAHWTDCEAYALPTSKVSGGGGFHYYHDEVNGGVAPASSGTRCRTEEFHYGFYGHGSNTGPETAGVTITDPDAVDCDFAVSVGWAENAWVIDGLVAEDCGGLVRATHEATVGASAARRSSYSSRLTGTCVGVHLSADATVEDTDFVFQTSGAAQLYAANPPDGETNLALSLSGVNSEGAIGPTVASAQQVDLTLTNSDVGELCDGPAGDYPLANLDASGSTFGLGGRSLATIQGDHPGVDGTNTII